MIRFEAPRSDKGPIRWTRTDKAPEGWSEFMTQRRTARRRGIRFEFTFVGWWAWWQVDGRWARRGRESGGLVMARKGDVGPYSPENVYCATHAENVKDLPPGAKAEKVRRMVANRPAIECPHLAAGEAHPKSRPVITPAGRFGNVRMAAEHHGITPSAASRKAKAGAAGWRYV